jgi:hypothetical protein
VAAKAPSGGSTAVDACRRKHRYASDKFKYILRYHLVLPSAAVVVGMMQQGMSAAVAAAACQYPCLLHVAQQHQTAWYQSCWKESFTRHSMSASFLQPGLNLTQMQTYKPAYITFAGLYKLLLHLLMYVITA